MLQTEREQVVRYCNLMLERGLTRGTGGNISIRSGDYVAISPASVEYPTMKPEDVPVVDLDGNIVFGENLRPSCEVGMHLASTKSGRIFPPWCIHIPPLPLPLPALKSPFPPYTTL